MGKTRHSTIETSPDAYNNQPSCQYMCMVMVANEIDEAVDVRPGELEKRTQQLLPFFRRNVSWCTPNTPSDRCGNAEIIHTTQSTGEKK